MLKRNLIDVNTSVILGLDIIDIGCLPILKIKTSVFLSRPDVTNR